VLILIVSLQFLGGYITHPEFMTRETAYKLKIMGEPPVREILQQSISPPDTPFHVRSPPLLVVGRIIEIVQTY
jgi:hypothetical protein